MAYKVYTIARLRNIPFWIFDTFFQALPLQAQGIALLAPYAHDALWKRGNALVSEKLKLQNAIGGVS